jgi:hypothetical protein
MGYTRALTLCGALGWVLTGCGGGGGSDSGGTSQNLPPAGYTVGGSISGLTTTGLSLTEIIDPGVLPDGKPTYSAIYSLSVPGGAASYVFPTLIASTHTYTVQIGSMPPSQGCDISSQAGTIASANVANVAITCGVSTTTGTTGSSGQWTWMSGSNTVNGVGVYGTQGVPAATNNPGARTSGATWIDSSGNFWLFGGSVYGDSINNYLYNDLWTYSATTGQWTWVSGSSMPKGAATYGVKGVAAQGNVPSARSSSVTWTDTAGNLWLFGGIAYAGTITADLDDLWRFNTITHMWTWVGGSMGFADDRGVYGTKGVPAAPNLPGPRHLAVSWADDAGNFWLFGGYGFDSTGTGGSLPLNDLWTYSPSTGFWTWVSGSTIGNSVGVYGAQGTAASGNLPGGRGGSASWADRSGSFWVFGGYCIGANAQQHFCNDLWKFTPTISGNILGGMWTWVNGSQTGQDSNANYGTQGVAALANVPGPRNFSASSIDGTGQFWLYGGEGNFSSLTDLWQFTPSTGLWTWISGPAESALVPKPPGVYGVKGTAAPGNIPGGRYSSMSWLDKSGALWIFGGEHSQTGIELLNDLWRYSP